MNTATRVPAVASFRAGRNDIERLILGGAGWIPLDAIEIIVRSDPASVVTISIERPAHRAELASLGLLSEPT